MRKTFLGFIGHPTNCPVMNDAGAGAYFTKRNFLPLTIDIYMSQSHTISQNVALIFPCSRERIYLQK